MINILAFSFSGLSAGRCIEVVVKGAVVKPKELESGERISNTLSKEVWVW